MFKISIVEDDNNNCKTLVDALNNYMKKKNLDFQVNSFSNAENFISTYCNDVDIIFMDIELSGINGMEASKLIRKKDQKVIIVFITNMASFAIEGYQVNALDFILKPLKIATFDMKMDRIIENTSTDHIIMIDKLCKRILGHLEIL